ncbi:MAG: hypothetical protein AB1726_17120 [Planctomycetota bacterium]
MAPSHERPCPRCASPLEAGDLRCAICGQATPAAEAPAAAARVEFLRCQGCAAAVAYDAALQGLACAFCGEVLELAAVEDPPEDVEGWLPFTVDRAGARAALRRWQSERGFFRPGDLAARARVEALRPLWWVGWVFDARARISWTADSNEGARRSFWAPHAGQADMVFDDLLVPASRGLSLAETAALAPGYDLTSVQAAPAGAPDAVFERFDVQRSLARRLVAEALHRAAADRVERSKVPGSRARKVQVVPFLRALETRRYGFPAWVLAYRYGDRVFRAVVCGQDAERVVGQAPVSAARILLAIAGALAVAVFAAFLLAAVLRS